MFAVSKGSTEELYEVDLCLRVGIDKEDPVAHYG